MNTPPPQKQAARPRIAEVGQDCDVVAGFPVKRFVLMLLYANMILLGGAFVAAMTLAIYSLIHFTFFSGYLGRNGGVAEFLEYFHDAIETIWGYFTADLHQTGGMFLLASIPGTLGGIAWYLILRWRESVILKKRLLAGKRPLTRDWAEISPDPGSANSPNTVLH